jgi:hypothetical protein
MNYHSAQVKPTRPRDAKPFTGRNAGACRFRRLADGLGFLSQSVISKSVRLVTFLHATRADPMLALAHNA